MFTGSIFFISHEVVSVAAQNAWILSRALRFVDWIMVCFIRTDKMMILKKKT